MKRLPMRKIREALRLRADGFSGRQVAQSLCVARATISEYFRRADLEGLSWPLPADLSDADLESRLFPICSGDALEINAHSYTSLHSILKNGLDRQRREPTTDGPAITHPNIRGADYFH
jgi:hypothetical protein